ncbi:MAG: T9SS type A sorting domain-containing protein [Muribaculaceae bacterium]|nr:T9SS type A sorting domain-containing protein [Muribaculaceae bacterium]
MKKIYSLVAAAALAISGIMYAAVGDVAFEAPNFATSPENGPGNGSAWTKVDGGDGSTWSYFASSKSLRIWKSGTVTAAQNDWLVSPKLDLEAGKTYEVSMVCKFHAGSSEAGNIDLHYTSVYPTISGLESSIAPETALASLENVNGDTKIGDSYLSSNFTLSGKFVAGEGDNYVALHVYGEYKGGFYVFSCKVVEAEAEQAPEPIEPDPVEPEDHDCHGIQAPYASPIAISSSAYDPAWIVLDSNGDGKKWLPVNEISTNCMKISYTSYSTPNHDDWMISPAIHLEKDVEYIVAYDYATDHATEMMDVYLAQSSVPEKIVESTPIAVLNKENTSKKFKTQSVVFTPAATGDYHMAFHATTSPGNQWYIWVGNVKIMENVFAPAAVTGLTATPAENPTLEVKLDWALPTVDVFGAPIGEDKVFEKLEIFRDEEPRAIAEFTEPVTTFTDSEETGLTSGKHTYSVIVTYSGAASPAAKVGPTLYVGPFEPMAIPAEAPVNSEFVGAWKNKTGEGHSANANVWGPCNYSTPNLTNPDRMRIQLKVYSDASNAWTFSPEFKVEEPGFYEVEISASLGSTYDKVWIKSFLANAQDVDAEMISLDAIDWKNFKSSVTSQKAMIYVPAAGNYSVASQVYTTDDDMISPANVYELRKVAMGAGQMVPNTVTDLKAKAADDESLAVNLSWTNPTLSTAGTELAPGSYYTEVYRKNGNDFELIATLTNGEDSYVDEVPAAGAYTYGVQTLATGTNAKMDNQPTALSSWAGPRELPLPYTVQMNSASEENVSRYIWEAIDANDDGKTWGFGYSDRMECAQPAQEIEDMPGYYQYEDYLLSPVFTLAPGYYQLTFQMYGRASYHNSGYEMFMNVGLVETGFIPGRSEIISKTQVSYNSTSYTNKTVAFKVEEAGKYQLVFAADEINYKVYSTSTNLGLGKVEFKYLPVLPGVATDLAVEVGADKALSAVFSWRNPSTSNVEGVEPEITQALVFRDGEQIASITEDLVAGEISSWEDDEVPASGKHTYSVQIFTAEGTHAAEAPSVVSAWIGAGIDAPYAVEPLQYEDHGWEHHSPNKTQSYGYDTNCFTLNNTNGARYEQGNKDVDGYLMSPQFEFNHTQKYKITVKGWKTSQTAEEQENGYPVEILVGTEGTPDTWTKVGEIAIRNANSYGERHPEFFIIGDENLAAVPVLYAAEEGEGEGEAEPTEPELAPGSTADVPVAVPAGTQRIAFHVNQDLNNGLLMFNKIYLDKEGEPTGIDAVEVAEGILIGADGLRFDGTAKNVAVYDLTGKLLSFAPEAEGQVSFSGLAKGVYIVRLSLDGKDVALKVAL